MMAKRAVTSRYLKTNDGDIRPNGRGRNGYYRELAGVYDVSSDDEVCHNSVASYTDSRPIARSGYSSVSHCYELYN